MYLKIFFSSYKMGDRIDSLPIDTSSPLNQKEEEIIKTLFKLPPKKEEKITYESLSCKPCPPPKRVKIALISALLFILLNSPLAGMVIKYERASINLLIRTAIFIVLIYLVLLFT